MRIIFFGNNVRGIATLETLLAHGYNIIAVVGVLDTNNAKDMFASIRPTAIKNKIPLFEPSKVNSIEFEQRIKELNPDLIILCGYNKILRKNIINIPHLGCINMHSGKLPEYKGTAVLNWQIINNEKVIGLSILFIDEGIDTGDVIKETFFELGINDNINDVIQKVNEIFPMLLLEALNDIKENKIIRKKQKYYEGCYYTKRLPRDGIIRWNLFNALEIHNLVRALCPPYPGAFTLLDNNKIVISKTKLLDENIRGIPGRVVLKKNNGVVIIAKDRGILVEKVYQKQEKIDANKIFKIGNDCYCEY